MPGKGEGLRGGFNSSGRSSGGGAHAVNDTSICTHIHTHKHIHTYTHTHIRIYSTQRLRCSMGFFVT